MADSWNSKTKLKIVSMDDGTSVEAQYNPKEFQVDKTVPWQKHKDSKADEPYLEFTGAEGRTMALELVFDGFEQDVNVHGRYVEPLLHMAKMRSQDGPEAERRPHKVKVLYGPIPDFIGVIESLSTKYTMFGNDGKPVRCTVNLKLKEAQRLAARAASAGAAGTTGGASGAT
ncbi:MAG: phage tail protein [Kofleriaceae bacterium]|jgi:hypothetical protein|nr:phage tail protein [Kofleriaceae bacterium]MBP6840996.1 phage tail protein [Kofleriaceae bacterium]MBP9203165.1 phage tail protein [Kofleriaceae bacterium]